MDKAEPKSTPGVARRRMPRWLLVAFGACAVVVAGLFVAAARLQSAPVAASAWLAERIEAQVDALLPEVELQFRGIRLGLDVGYHPQIYLDDVTVLRADGVPLVDLRSLQGDLSIGAALSGQVELRRVLVSGAVLHVERERDGTVDFAFGQGFGQTPIGDLGSAERVVAVVEDALAAPGLTALSEVSAEAVTINYVDAVSGQTWIGDGGQLRFFRGANSLTLSAEAAVLTGRETLSTLSLSLERANDKGDVAVSVVIDDAAATDIASQAPALAWLAVLDANVSGSLRTTVTNGALGPLKVSLDLGEGALKPNAAARAITFTQAFVAFEYDAAETRIAFDDILVDSAWGSAQARGTAWLGDFDGVMPAALLGQFQLRDITARPGALYPEPMRLDEAWVDFRMALNPFTLEIGQATLLDDGKPIVLSGQVAAEQAGWGAKLDIAADEVTIARVTEFWPQGPAPKLLKWLQDNVTQASARDVSVAVRVAPGERPKVSFTHGFSEAEFRMVRHLPPLQDAAGSLVFEHDTLTILIERGVIQAPQGGLIDVAGSVFHVSDTRQKPAPAELTLAASGTVTAVLATLDEPPWAFLTKANQPVTLADGRAVLSGTVEFPLRRGNKVDDMVFDLRAELSAVRSDTLVQGRTLSLPRALARFDGSRLSISGAGRIDQVPIRGAWDLVISPERPPSELVATVELSPATLDAFNISLPPGSVRGVGEAELVMRFIAAAPPEFTLSSKLVGLGVRVAAVGWDKAPSRQGELRVAGTLGESPRVEELLLAAPGLRAEGAIALNADGAFSEMQLSRLTVGDWLQGALTLKSRGAVRAPEVVMSGSQLDLSQAQFQAVSSGRGDSAPITARFDRVRVGGDLTLTDVRAQLQAGPRLTGNFEARVAGGTPVRGALSPSEHGTSIIVQSNDGGGVLRDAGILRQLNGGAMTLALTPLAAEGSYDGTLNITDLRVGQAPVLASLLSAVSIVGLFEQLDGDGLYFSEVDAGFRLTPGTVIIKQGSAVGPSLGVSLDGYYDTARGQLDMQGVVSPVYLLNSLGSILTRRGEGLIGFNYTLRGPASAPDVAVNPLSLLTPGMFREIFRRPPPDVGQ
ncbi:MAG: AsmA-like C-terminal region-containing protein [Pseudomonadota bacterium]